MKKIIAVLAISLAYFGAGAQTTQINACGVNKGKVCRVNGNSKSCYKTAYAENFKVCKGNSGYFICCEAPNYYNSTHPQVQVVAANRPYVQQYQYTPDVADANTDMQVPQSQSYVVTSSNTYAGYYPKKNEIKVCYVGDNVAEENLAPYKGCPSPQSEGPEVNKQRNLNVSNPESMPPLQGRPE